MKHNHIDLPRGFYAMLCHDTGLPRDQWDYVTRLVAEAENMRAVLVRLTQHILVNEAKQSVGGVIAEANAILGRINAINPPARSSPPSAQP